MEAKELRIGNSVYCWNPSTGTHNETVISINWKHIRNRVQQPEDTTYEPIPLTEEWLLKFGFENHSSNEFWFRKKQLCISVLGKIELISWDMQLFKVDTMIEYVHQLQNLYFALTGEELILKEK